MADKPRGVPYLSPAGEGAMDTEYLRLRGRTWYVRVPFPSWSDREFVLSLRTSSLREAQELRDTYLRPLLVAASGQRLVTAIAHMAALADEEVKRRLVELKLTVGAGEGLTLRQAGDAFTGNLEASGAHAPGTIRQYRGDIDAACLILGPDLPAASITKKHAIKLRDAFLQRPRNWQHMADPLAAAPAGAALLNPNTVARILRELRTIFDWLEREGRVRLADNPFRGVTAATLGHEHKRPPTAAEADALLDLPEPRGFDSLTWWALPRLARYTGARVGELSHLRGEDVETRDGVRLLSITTAAGRLKTSSSARLVPVSDKLAPVVDRLLAERPHGRLLRAGAYKDKAAHRFLKLWNPRAKKVAPDLSFHNWRTFANTRMAEAGVDVHFRELLLGHVGTRTQAAYTAPDLAAMLAAVNTIP
jgi:integrase